jgi:hypothetical protein
LFAAKERAAARRPANEGVPLQEREATDFAPAGGAKDDEPGTAPSTAQERHARAKTSPTDEEEGETLAARLRRRRE